MTRNVTHGGRGHFKIGVYNALFAPPEVSEDHVLEWSIRTAAAYGADVVGGDPRAMFSWGAFNIDPGYWAAVHDLADDYGVQIEPFVRPPFDLVNEDSGRARTELVQSIHAAKLLGGPTLRSAYRITNSPEQSRFSPAEPIVEHLARLAANLKEASRIAADEGVVIAIENHVDFSGAEWRSVLEGVGSSDIQSALDTANGLRVGADPVDDVNLLAPWAVTTHLKDLRKVNDREYSACALGDGFLDVPRTIQTIVRESPLGERIPFIIEVSRPGRSTGADIEAHAEMLGRSVRYLYDLLEGLDPADLARRE